MKVLVERERTLVCEIFDVLSGNFDRSSFDELVDDDAERIVGLGEMVFMKKRQSECLTQALGVKRSEGGLDNSSFGHGDTE